MSIDNQMCTCGEMNSVGMWFVGGVPAFLHRIWRVFGHVVFFYDPALSLYCSLP